MNNIEIYEKALKVQRRINALGLDVNVGMLAHKDEDTGLYLKSSSDKHRYCLNHKSIDEIIKIAIDLSKPTYIKLKGVCVDKLGSTVYLLENGEYIPRTLQGLTADGVILDNLDNNEIFNIDFIYIKE